MMNKGMFTAVLAVTLVLAGYMTARAQQGGQAVPTKVAVVNLAEVLEKSAMQSAMAAQNKTKGEKLKAEEVNRRGEIQKLNTQLTPLNPGSDAWNRKRKEIQKKIIELEVWTRTVEQEANQDRAQQFAEIYKAANEATAKVAEAQGYDMVIQGSDLPDTSRMTAQNLQNLAVSRKVVYAKNAVNITDQVLLQADAAFKAR